MVEPCPLCQSSAATEFWRDATREYWRCSQCALVWVPSSFHVSRDEERAEYDLHENDPRDPGYRRFLGRLAEPLIARLAPGTRGLDFGCGPGPTLSVMLEEAGYAMDLYDVFFADDLAVFERRYGFITATEVVEHLADPGTEIVRLFDMLEPGGVLAIMTGLVNDEMAFSTWHYKNDKTHIAFFSRMTFEWLAQSLDADLEFASETVVFLEKPKA